MDPVAVQPVFEADLKISKNPVTELAAAAVRARVAAGLADANPGPEYLIVALPAGMAVHAAGAVATAAAAAIVGKRPA